MLFVRSRRGAARKYSGLRGSPRGGRGPGGYPYNGLYGDAPTGRDAFFRLLVYERVGKYMIKVYQGWALLRNGSTVNLYVERKPFT